MPSRLLCSSNTSYACLMSGKYFLTIMTHVLAGVDGMGQEKHKSVFGPWNQELNKILLPTLIFQI